jgi:hypothetical protein
VKRTLFWAIVSSVVMSIVVTAYLVLFSYTAGIPKEGVQYPPDFYKWSMHDQNEWNLKNLELVSGFGYVRERMKYPGFAQEVATVAGYVFAISFPSCLLFAFLSRRRLAPTDRGREGE